MKFGAEFVVGVAVGIAGTVCLGIIGVKKLYKDPDIERQIKSALVKAMVKAILGEGCTYYSFKRSSND